MLDLIERTVERGVFDKAQASYIQGLPRAPGQAVAAKSYTNAWANKTDQAMVEFLRKAQVKRLAVLGCAAHSFLALYSCSVPWCVCLGAMHVCMCVQ